ncbi:hypothetical protein Tsubulata_007839, partial [Turnera subulata]
MSVVEMVYEDDEVGEGITLVKEAREGLLQWKASLDKKSQSALSSWAGGNHCKWVGISCDSSGSVIHIRLTHFGLTGTLDSLNFSSFSNLLVLNLSNNSLYGSIPRGIGGLSRLMELDLSRNRLTGSVPYEIGMLPSLEYLELNTNNLTSTIPASIGNLTKLSFLSLWDNRLSGYLPQEIGLLASLNVIRLINNNFSGGIPSSQGNLTKLIELSIPLNNFTGSIPPEIGQLKSLTIMYVFTNKLSGSLPREMNNLTQVKKLSLSQNQFTGYLPQLCSGGLLEHLSANQNYFSGQIPHSLQNCTSLTRLRVDGNKLSGDITENFGIYGRLDYVDLSFNNFYGQLSSKWGRCLYMTGLKISNNNISGVIPSELGKATRLQVIDLSSNRLQGDIPRELGDLKLLFSLTLDNNILSGVLSGVIPLQILMLSNLRHLRLANNCLAGSIPKELGECSKLSHLNLSANNFSGTIPFEIGMLKSLEVLVLSRNSVSGEIPGVLAGLTNLQRLNFSHSILNGSIPTSSSNWASLITVDVSYNELEGPLPDARAFREAPFEAYRDNLGLCGEATGLSPYTVDKKGNGSNSVILIVLPLFGGLFFLCTVIFSFFTIRRRYRRGKSASQEVKRNDLLTVLGHNGNEWYEEIIKATEEFDSKYCIGQGGNGAVYRAVLTTGKVVAVKRIHLSQSSYVGSVAMLSIPFWFMSSLKMDALFSKKKKENGCLYMILSSAEKSRELDWSRRLNVVKGVANALSYMHYDCSPPIIHRDISSNNVLLDSEYEAHLADFGTARHLILDSTICTSVSGTPGYIAPALEVIVGKYPTELMSSSIGQNTPLKDVIDPRIPVPEGHVAGGVASITKMAFSCLSADPSSRPTMRQISLELTARWPSLPKPISEIALADLLPN